MATRTVSESSTDICPVGHDKIANALVSARISDHIGQTSVDDSLTVRVAKCNPRSRRQPEGARVAINTTHDLLVGGELTAIRDLHAELLTRGYEHPQLRAPRLSLYEITGRLQAFDLLGSMQLSRSAQRRAIRK